MTPLNLAAYIGVAFLVVFVSLSLASGLYFVAEFIEEKPRAALRIIKYTIKATVVLHIVVLGYRPPLLHVALSVAAQMVYWKSLSTFPYFKAESLVLGAVVTLVNAGSWLSYFRSSALEGHYHHLLLIFGFMIAMVLLVPFWIILSLAANDMVLPGPSVPVARRVPEDAGKDLSPMGPTSEKKKGTKPRGWILGVLQSAVNKTKAGVSKLQHDY